MSLCLEDNGIFRQVVKRNFIFTPALCSYLAQSLLIQLRFCIRTCVCVCVCVYVCVCVCVCVCALAVS